MNTGEGQGMRREEHEEVKRLKREVAELRRANEILKTASAFFVAEPDRPVRGWSPILTDIRMVSGSSRFAGHWVPV